MRYTLVSPRLAIQKGDFLGSGVPYWPIELATLAGLLVGRGNPVEVLDLFGSNPKELEDRRDHYLQGQSLSSFLDKDSTRNADCFIVFAISYMSHEEVLDILRTLRKSRPSAPLVVLENAQAVTAYALPPLQHDFFAAGADVLLCGEPFHNWDEIEDFLQNGPNRPRPANALVRGDASPVSRFTAKVRKRYPLPAWELFRLDGYWSLPYSHGPKQKRFLPIITSRGCPYPCDFCVVPETSEKRWYGSPPEDVVAEILYLRDKFDVRHFQLEDLNPTVYFRRFRRICELLIERQAGIRFYIVSGTKAETVPVEEVGLLAKAGCRYLSISPESGSAAVMKSIGKRFDYEHAAKLVQACRQHGIRTQACFLVGHPAETPEAVELSRLYVRRLVECGLDEVAIFIVASFAGSRLYEQARIAMADKTVLPSFSPRGRADYAELRRRRRKLITAFFLAKLRQGFALWQQGLRALLGVPQTKMENLPLRLVYVNYLIMRHRLKKKE